MKLILNTESLYKLRSGIGHYTYNLLSGLLGEEPIKDIQCFQGSSWCSGKHSLEQLPQISSSQTLKNNVIGKVRSIPFLYEAVSQYRNYKFYQGAKNIKNAVYHEPNFILKPYDGATVATVHDLSHIHYPGYHPTERVRYLNKRLTQTLEKATHIITDSSFVADELVKEIGVSPEKVTAIYPGISSCFRPMKEHELLPKLKKYNLEPKKYILSVATLEPRKNIEGLLDAYLLLDPKLRREYPLVLVGAKGWKNDKLLSRIQSLIQAGEIYYLGYIPEDDLPCIYAGAFAFVYIPFYEGFGFPALEALASGVPVLASNASCLPEVLGDASLLVDPDDIDMASENLLRLVEDASLRVGLIQKGITRARKFVWKDCLVQTLSVYRQALKS